MLNKREQRLRRAKQTRVALRDHRVWSEHLPWRGIGLHRPMQRVEKFLIGHHHPGRIALGPHTALMQPQGARAKRLELEQRMRAEQYRLAGLLESHDPVE